jgi:hypothetical protein
MNLLPNVILENQPPAHCSPILNIIFQSKVIAGAKVKEEFISSKKKVVITSSEKLHPKAFEFLAKIIQLIHSNKFENEGSVSISYDELCDYFGFKSKDILRDIKKIDAIIKPLMSTLIQYYAVEDESTTINLISKFHCNEKTEIITITLHEELVIAIGMMWNKYLDVQQYTAITSHKTRTLYQYIESLSLSANAKRTFKRSFISDFVGVNLDEVEIMDADKKKNAIYNLNKSINASLKALKKIGLLISHEVNGKRGNKHDPIYTVVVRGKKHESTKKNLPEKRNAETITEKYKDVDLLKKGEE